MKYEEISVNDLNNLNVSNKKFILLDVRTDMEVIQSKIPNSTHIPMDEISNRIEELDNKDNIIVYCKSGKRSAKICEYLVINNFINVKNLKGGIIEWAKQVDPSLIIY